MEKTLSKLQVLEYLNAEIMQQLNSDDRRLRLKGRLNANVYKMVKNSPLETYEHISYTRAGNHILNKGNVMENILLSYKNATHESEYFEIKYLGNDTPNILINTNVKLVYIVVNKATLKGAFIIRNMKDIQNQRLTLNYLIENDLLHECKALEKFLGL